MNWTEERAQWVLCPACKGKTRLKLLKDTVLKNDPLFCPKCRRETIISAECFRVSVVQERNAHGARTDAVTHP